MAARDCHPVTGRPHRLWGAWEHAALIVPAPAETWPERLLRVPRPLRQDCSRLLIGWHERGIVDRVRAILFRWAHQRTNDPRYGATA